MGILHLGPIDYAIMGVYFLFVLGIGWFLKSQIKTSQDFFQSGHTAPVRNDRNRPDDHALRQRIHSAA